MVTGPKPVPAEELFFRHVMAEPNSGCWLWTGTLSEKGYGWFAIRVKTGARRKQMYAHKFSYIMHKGPVPNGLEIDHKCRTRCCVNPDHLEAVTHYTNIMRGENFSAINKKKEKCKRGHELSPKPGGPGHRFCRVCAKVTLRRAYVRRRRAAGYVINAD